MSKTLQRRLDALEALADRRASRDSGLPILQRAAGILYLLNRARGRAGQPRLTAPGDMSPGRAGRFIATVAQALGNGGGE